MTEPSNVRRDMGAPRGQLFVISAASGTGKTSLVHALVDSTPAIKVATSHTTRAVRPGERPGVDYYFVDVDTFNQMIDDGAFLEYAQVFDHFYGTSRAAVEQMLSADEDVILEIDWQGARKIRQAAPDAVSVFILPPTYEELERRLVGRGHDEPAVIRRRMQAALRDMTHYDEYDYLIFNDQFDQALLELQSVVRAARLATPVQQTRMRGALDRLMAS